MKAFSILAGIIIVGALGYYLFVMSPALTPEPEQPTNTNSQAKIDINAVCDGALAYMSFPNGTEAEAWVLACRRGEHPEAIDQWKQVNGITDDQVI